MIITALDFDDSAKALEFVDRIDPELSRLKVGKELFTTAGPRLVEQLQLKGFDVFLDLKFHDIPNTVASAVRAAASLGVWMVNVHASGGPRMLDAAREAIQSGSSGEAADTKPLLIAVTVLTSMDDKELHSIGVAQSAEEQVRRLTQLTVDHGLDGVVCSPREVQHIRSFVPDTFLTVTPGVRPAANTVSNDDQRRVMTPSDAIHSGSNFLVIGRPITQADNPLEALQQIHAQIAS